MFTTRLFAVTPSHSEGCELEGIGDLTLLDSLRGRRCRCRKECVHGNTEARQGWYLVG